ncbi:MAG: methylenetetrahydrofolate reductase [NAD(P)H] [Burkholderia sp.]|nr:methylenetetrahydrofolate reductase [NAD(P)H] [Burkholderia sp.]
MKLIELSFEFFPPKTAEGINKLGKARSQLLPLRPKFVSVTFGACGSTKNGTFDTVLDMKKYGLKTAPHLSCIGSSKDSLRIILNQYKSNKIRYIVALRGDIPSQISKLGELRYASELVSFIRAEYGDWFHIKVAGYPEYHPQSSSPKKDLENFANKVRAGANSAITQYFFNTDVYFRFVDDIYKLGIDVPIIPGIMPITNFSQLIYFSKMCGAEIPRWIVCKLESLGNDRDAVLAFGVDVVTALCQRLIDSGVPGLHFYTLNIASATQEICKRLGL